MRIRLQKHITPGGPPLLDKLYAEHVAAVAAPATTVEIHGLPPGTYDGPLPEHLVGYGQFGLLFGEYFTRSALEAERDGCDAWISGAGQDPGLAAARVRARIPVVGYGEAVWHLAHAQDHRLGVLGFIRELAEPITANIHKAGADLASYQVIDHGPELVQRALTEEDFGPLLDAYVAAARSAAQAGAQWLVPAEGVPNVIFVHLGIRELAGLPVIDPGGLAIKTAEHLCQLRALGIIARPNAGYWRRLAPHHLIQQVEQMLAGPIGTSR